MPDLLCVTLPFLTDQLFWLCLPACLPGMVPLSTQTLSHFVWHSLL